MGFYNQFPYVNTDNLNIDWVLDVCKKAQETIRNINHNIEIVVRPMIDTQNQFYQRLVNSALSEMRVQTSDMKVSLNQTTALLNQTVYENGRKVDRAVNDINNKIAAQTAYVDSALSRSLNEMNSTLAYYRAVFDSQSVQSQAQLNSIIKMHDAEIRILIEGEKAELANMQAEIRHEVTSGLNEMYTIKLDIYQQMAQLRDDVSEDVQRNNELLQAIGRELVDQVSQNAADLETYYQYVSEIIDRMFEIMDNSISLKADKSYVDDQIQRVEKLITAVNGDIQLINPSTGKEDSLQKILYDIYNDGRFLALTAYEYGALKLSAEDYDNVRVTSYQYDYFAKWYFIIYRKLWICYKEYIDNRINPLEEEINSAVQKLQTEIDTITAEMDKCCKEVKAETRMYNPFNGQITLVSDVVNMILNTIRVNALTASQYDALLMDASVYDSKDITAFNYDWNGKNFL